MTHHFSHETGPFVLQLTSVIVLFIIGISLVKDYMYLFLAGVIACLGIELLGRLLKWPSLSDPSLGDLYYLYSVGLGMMVGILLRLFEKENSRRS